MSKRDEKGPKPNETRGRPAFNTEELDQLKSRFREHRRRNRQTRATVDARAGGRTSMRRPLLLLVLLAICVVVTFFFLAGKTSGPSEPVEVPLGEVAPKLGEQARLPAACREAEPAHFAYLDGLAPGSAQAQQRQRQTMQRLNLPLEIENSVGMRFRLIPARPADDHTFWMGSPEDEPRRGEDELRYEVVMDEPFYLGMHEVTQQQFEAVMKFNPSHRRGPNLPVEEVTWQQADKFCRNLCREENLPENTYALPHEREWEYACRAGTQTPFFFGHQPTRLHLYAAFNAGQTRPVGVGVRPNAWGLRNMPGNVWEWCENNFYHYASGEDKVFRRKPFDPHYRRSMRSGQWAMDDWQHYRSAARFCTTGTTKSNMIGFRVKLNISPEAFGASPEGTASETDTNTPTPPPPPDADKEDDNDTQHEE